MYLVCYGKKNNNKNIYFIVTHDFAQETHKSAPQVSKVHSQLDRDRLMGGTAARPQAKQEGLPTASRSQGYGKGRVKER